MFVMQLCWSVYLCFLGWLDIRHRKIPLLYLLLGIGTAFGVLFFQEKGMWVLSLGGAGVGILFLGISKMTKEALGYGDSLVILGLGILLGLWQVMTVLVMAFSLAAISSMILLVLKKMNRRTTLPFIPFLTLSYLVIFVSGLIP